MRHVVSTLGLAATLCACGSSVNTGLLDYDAASGSDAGSDVRAASDTPATTDTPSAIDIPITVDVPPGVDVPVAVDVTPTVDVPTAMDVPAAIDVPIASTDVGSILPPRDAGPLPFDGGTLGDPAWVSLDVRVGGTCTPVAACGGPVLGTWDVSGGCIEVPLPSQLMLCPGARVSRSAGRARGRVIFAPTIAYRASQWEVEAELFIPQICATIAGGCSAIEGYVRPSFPDSRCVSEGAGNCRCAVRQSGTINDGDAYTTTSTQIVSTLSGRRWDYCVSGERMRYNDTSSGSIREPGPIELTRRSL